MAVEMDPGAGEARDDRDRTTRDRGFYEQIGIAILKLGQPLDRNR